MIPFVRKDSYLPNKKLVPLVIGNGYTTEWAANGLAQYFKETGKIVSFNTTKSSPMLSLVCSISPVQEGSGDPAPDNVRPITGQTGVTVYLRGKNLFPTITEVERNGVTFSQVAGGYNLYGTPTTTANCPVFEGTLKAGTYTVNGITGASNSTFRLGYATYVDGGWTSWSYVSTADKTFVFAEDTTIRFYIFAYQAYGKFENLVLPYQLEIGPEATAYETPSGSTIPVTIPTPPGTVYGGTLDLVSGVLTVDRVKRVFVGADSETWDAYPSYNGFSIATEDMNTGSRQAGKSNWLKVSSNSTHDSFSAWLGVNNKKIYCIEIASVLSAYTVAGWKAYLAENNLEVEYPLATPLVYQLTPQEISTLVGQNNVWQESADDVTVETNIYE